MGGKPPKKGDKMTDTEKLRERIGKILEEVRNTGVLVAPREWHINQILQACKESGLVFRGKRYNIDLTTVLWGIKEIGDGG